MIHSFLSNCAFASKFMMEELLQIFSLTSQCLMSVVAILPCSIGYRRLYFLLCRTVHFSSDCWILPLSVDLSVSALEESIRTNNVVKFDLSQIGQVIFKIFFLNLKFASF